MHKIIKENQFRKMKFSLSCMSKISQSHQIISYGFSMKLFPAGSSRMKVKDESPVAQAFSFNKNWSIASAV
jgi:hypothetical protein